MFTSKDIEHYAELGRIRITAAEKRAFAQEFATILEYVAKLERVNVDTIKPMNGGVLFYNRFRSDSVDLERKGDKVNEVAHTVRAFPQSQDGYLKVPPIFTE